jgi:putative endonuclease
MAYWVYILYSKKLDKYYIGCTDDINRRLAEHNAVDNRNWTASGSPWTLYHSMSCHSLKQARQIEYHIKQMKSKKYINNLKHYPEMAEKLLHQFPAENC